MNRAVIEAFMNMRPRQGDPESARILGDAELRAKVLYQIERWPAFALPSPAAPGLICGVAIEGDIGEVWMVAGEDFDASIRTILRQQRFLCRMALQVFQLKRIQMRVSLERAGAARWAGALGFVPGEQLFVQPAKEE